ncbi:cystathionine gamma-synthase family protein [Hydromonas duriensis]|uniref:O-acetylhomoserine (Thiol)-lyase n=1 Tax=Hydromonas duriensis TaxID=1527608 RepID=A0A4R6Y6D8_9BURK|nr:cystathionine gamma-synthase family protein [Hydromonas duriensis]TDR31069.1 O-acetylhomoserine (thiol)-lyase [Hydromonas duriensis]
MKKLHLQTQLLHSDRLRGTEYAASHQPIHKSVQWGYARAQDIADTFQNKRSGFTYARGGNPTTAALEAQINALEDGIGTISFATGMSAISTVILALLKAGDHLVASQYLFGNTTSLFSTLAAHGISITYADVTDADKVKAAMQPNTRMVFLETIANPRTQVADLKGIGELCQHQGVLFVVDATMSTPALLRAKDYGASIVMNSLSKGLAGHGAALGGALTDTGLFDWSVYPNIFEGYRKGEAKNWGLLQLRKKGLRDIGGALSADSAQQIALGLETFFLRNERACQNAMTLANWLNAHPAVEKVDYPGLSEHPQHARASELFKGSYGTLLSFTVKDSVKHPFDVLDTLKIIMMSTHLGDNRTMALPVTQTIYAEMSAERRAEWGIADGLIRISVGIEQVDDLIDDLAQALA